MEKLILTYNTWNEYHPIIQAALLHGELVKIHPFVDGNGRTSRFISSYLLSKEFEFLIGFRLSYTIKEHIKDYYEEFLLRYSYGISWF